MQRIQEHIWASQDHSTIIEVVFLQFPPLSIPRKRQQTAYSIFFSDIAVFIYLPRNAIHG